MVKDRQCTVEFGLKIFGWTLFTNVAVIALESKQKQIAEQKIGQASTFFQRRSQIHTWHKQTSQMFGHFFGSFIRVFLLRVSDSLIDRWICHEMLYFPASWLLITVLYTSIIMSIWWSSLALDGARIWNYYWDHPYLIWSA